MYIPSEFGVDHYIHDFPHLEWDAKKRHDELAREILDPSVK
ncbi:isoflavone reductase family protein, partial [Aspergillus arachidicola]